MALTFDVSQLAIVLAAGLIMSAIRLSPLLLRAENAERHTVLVERLALAAILFGASVSLLSFRNLPASQIFPQLAFVIAGGLIFFAFRSLSVSLIAGLAVYAAVLAWM